MKACETIIKLTEMEMEVNKSVGHALFVNSIMIVASCAVAASCLAYKSPNDGSNTNMTITTTTATMASFVIPSSFKMGFMIYLGKRSDESPLLPAAKLV